jgi:hypothetical protein
MVGLRREALIGPASLRGRGGDALMQAQSDAFLQTILAQNPGIRPEVARAVMQFDHFNSPDMGALNSRNTDPHSDRNNGRESTSANRHPGWAQPGFPSPGFPSPGFPGPGFPSPGSPDPEDMEAGTSRFSGNNYAGSGPDEESVESLCTMGFTREQAVAALLRYDNDLQRAVHHLLESG